MIKTIRTDLIRLFSSKRVCLAILGIVFCLYFSVYKLIGVNISIIYVFTQATLYIPFVMTYSLCAFVFAGTFCEDLENNFIMLCFFRDNFKYYILSKIIIIYLSSVIIMVLGSILFVNFLSCRLPWVASGDPVFEQLMHEGSLRYILMKKNYLLYTIMFSFKLGLLGGNLALLSSYISLEWNNKLFTYSIPFMVYCFIIYYCRDLFFQFPFFDIIKIFNSSFNVLKNDLLSFFWAILVSFFIAFILQIAIKIRLRRIIQNE